MESITLNSGARMPQLGIGAYQVASIAALDKSRPFFQMPDVLGRILLPAARINFDERQR